jgi:hypothetical protein
MTVLRPSWRSSRKQPTAHQSNSTELPMRYTPEPIMKEKNTFLLIYGLLIYGFY